MMARISLGLGSLVINLGCWICHFIQICYEQNEHLFSQPADYKYKAQRFFIHQTIHFGIIMLHMSCPA